MVCLILNVIAYYTDIHSFLQDKTALSDEREKEIRKIRG